MAGKTRGAGGGAKGATATDLVVVDEAPGKDKAARQVVLGWPGKLPAPVLDGTRATYTDVSPGLDVVVESRRSGFGLPHDFRTRVLGFSGCFLGVVVEVEDLLRGVVPQP